MFFSPGLEQLDPALLAFIKCHVTSPIRWELLRVLASQDGTWTSADELARRCHRPLADTKRCLLELVSDGIVEVLTTNPDEVSFRMAADEPTSVVLHRLIEATTHSLELRAIIAAHLQRVRQQSATIRPTAIA